jgi:hypothetical protein
MQKDTFSCFSTCELTKYILVWNCPIYDDDLWNLKLSYLNQFQQINIVTIILLQVS